MANIESIDSNFMIRPIGGRTDMRFYDCTETPFKLSGLIPPQASEGENVFLRLPSSVADMVNDGVKRLKYNTAGGRVRFKTDSPYVAIRTLLHGVGKMPHFALSGSCGFDMHITDSSCDDTYYAGTFMPPFDIGDTYESVIDIGQLKDADGKPEMREITIHFPLYSGVKLLLIGLADSARIAAPNEYKYPVPVVYYGSSITQGGCASRPGNAYQNIISRELDCEHINLGFSGSARGEDAIADYIASLEMSAFVYDYDHNAPSAEHLQNTHERMFLRIREKQPELPVIMVSRPKARLNEDEKVRRGIIERTCKNAFSRGDRNVYFIDGSLMMRTFGGDNGTVDGCHPTDLGFMCMAKVIGATLKNVLGR